MLLLSLLACDPELPQAAAEPTMLEAAQPPPLVEVLYAEPEGALQDRVRLLVWLNSAELTTDELRALRVLRAKVLRHHEVALAEREQARAEAAQVVSPLLEELERGLISGQLDEEGAAELAASIAAARSGVTDPRVASLREVEAVLAEGQALVELLGPGRKQSLANALFVLRAEAGEGVRPALYEGILGRPWDPGDFATLRRAKSPPKQDQLDPGGLWTLEAGELTTNQLEGEQLLVVAALLLEQEHLDAAIGALLGEPTEVEPAEPIEPPVPQE
jgi:hypothetical protein